VGTYNFREFMTHAGTYAMAGCAIKTIYYPHDSTTLTGSVTVDTLTSTRIHGTFNMKVVSPTQTVEVKNGVFAGHF
jgi:hypothetical protein